MSLGFGRSAVMSRLPLICRLFSSRAAAATSAHVAPCTSGAPTPLPPGAAALAMRVKAAIYGTPETLPPSPSPSLSLSYGRTAVVPSGQPLSGQMVELEPFYAGPNPTFLPPLAPRPLYIPPKAEAFERDFATHRLKSYVSLPHLVYLAAIRRDILHRCYMYQSNASFQGTHNSRNRAQVRFSNRKLYPQKGTGRARRGDRGSPLLHGGGKCHGPVPRSHFTDLPLRIRSIGVRVALAAKFKSGDLVLVDSFDSFTSSDPEDLLAHLNTHYPPKTVSSMLRIEALRKQAAFDAAVLKMPPELNMIMHAKYPDRTNLPPSGRKFQIRMRRIAAERAVSSNRRRYGSMLIVAGIEESPVNLVAAAVGLERVKVLPAAKVTVRDMLKYEYFVVERVARKWLELSVAPPIPDLSKEFETRAQ